MKFNNLVLVTVCALFLGGTSFAATAEAPVPCVPCAPCKNPVPVKKKVKRVRVKKPVPAPIVKKATCVEATYPLAFLLDASGSMMKTIKIEKKEDPAKEAAAKKAVAVTPANASAQDEEKQQEKEKELTKAAYAKKLILSVREKMSKADSRAIGLGAMSPFTIIFPPAPDEDKQKEDSQKSEPQKAQNEGILYEFQEKLQKTQPKKPEDRQREEDEFAKGMERVPDDLEIFGRVTNLGDGFHEMTEVTAVSDYNKKFSKDLEKGMKIILFTDGQKDNYGVELRPNLKKFQQKYPSTKLVFVVFHETDEDFDRIQQLGEDAHIPVYKGVELLTDDKALESFLSKEIDKDCK